MHLLPDCAGSIPHLRLRLKFQNQWDVIGATYGCVADPAVAVLQRAGGQRRLPVLRTDPKQKPEFRILEG